MIEQAFAATGIETAGSEPLVWIVFKIILIVLPLMLGVAYLTFAERKVIGYMQVRIGANRVGPRGWLQPIADVLKLVLKEVIIPSGANRVLYLAALRATFPRYRYDQIMRLGWKVFIPITIVWIVVVGLLVMGAVPPWFDR